MNTGMTEVYCGDGKGKTTLALGQSLRASVQGRSVIVIQFLKGKEKRELDFLEDLEGQDIKIFRFDKMDECYEMLSEQDKLEENKNIQNAVNFARKVIVTQECDFLVLDEILGVLDLGIIPVEELRDILTQVGNMHVVMTGRRCPDALLSVVDSITTISTESARR